MSCEHFNIEQVSQISLMNKMVYKDECTLCFYQSEDKDGINLCLTCFNGSCRDNKDMNIIDHTELHFNKTQHCLYLRINKFVERQEQKEQDVNKIAINKEGGFLDVEVITFKYEIYCAQCQKYMEVPQQLNQLVRSIEQQDSAYKKNTLESWELENTACVHAKEYPKQQTQKLEKLGNKCSECDLSTNLWLCVDCGNLGCGRKFYDGTGGNNHGISHYEKTGHKVSIKLGTLGVNSKPSCYCYTCNDETSIYEIEKTLQQLGLDLRSFVKTEKTINELSLELNLNFKLSNKFEKTEHLKKLSKEENCNGIDNIGNSCYLNSVIQNLSAVKEIENFCIHSSEKSLNHIKQCTEFPYNCKLCQFIKFVSTIRNEQYFNKFKSIKPYLFRYLFGKDHLEFRTQKQQDACEYMVHLFTFIQQFQDQLQVEYLQQMLGQSVTKYTCGQCQSYFIQNNYGKVFTLRMSDQIKQKIIKECEGKENYVYKLKLSEILSKGLVADDTVSDCSKCHKKCVFEGKTYFKQYPKYLLLHTERFTFNKGQAIKLLYDIDFQNDKNIDMSILDIDKLQLDESLEMKKNQQTDFNQESIQSLMSMGFSQQRCQRALKESGNNMETALNLLLSNVDNPQWDQDTNQSNQVPFFNQVWEIAGAMGVDKKYAEKVCKVNKDKNAEFCINYLLENPFDNGALADPQESIEEVKQENQEVQDDGNRNYKLLGGVVHLGKSVHVGHYVAFTRRKLNNNEKWVYFNDDKVYEAEKPKVGMSYVFFLQKN